MMNTTELVEIEAKQSSNKTRVVVFSIGIFFLVGLFLVFALSLQDVESTQLQGNAAPDFQLTTFEGDTVSLESLHGQIVVVNFWASWCIECYDEAPLLEQAYQDFKDQGVVFVGVDYLDTEKEALAYMAQYGITYPSGQDLGTVISDDFRITGVPETIFIDREGNVQHVQIGPIQQPKLYQLLQGLTVEETF